MVALYFIKIEIRTKKVLFLPKNFDFLQRNADISKINRVFLPNVMKLHMCVYLRTKFQVSSIILTSFRQEVILPLSFHKTEKKVLRLLKIKVTE